MPFFEPDGGTATPEGLMWLGILLTVVGLFLLIAALASNDNPSYAIAGLAAGIYNIWRSHQRKQQK